MDLYAFCTAPEHYVARERLLYTKVTYEMKLHGASFGEQLQMTEPEIDNQGYDFSTALGYHLLYLQNKATLSDTGVRSWDVHPVLLQPAFHDRDLAPMVDGFPVGGLIGASGGVLLHIIDADAARKNQMQVAYRYFDVFYASAVASGLWESQDFSRSDAKKVLRAIQTGNPGDRISLPIKAFLPIRSPAAIVAFRFHIPSPSNYISLGCAAMKQDERDKTLAESLKMIWRAEVSYWTHLKV
jgi:hypothetical protein